MADIFKVVDKTEREIRLSRERWSHITSPSSPHSYMASCLEEMKQTLSKPDKIVESVYDDSKVSYYKYYKIKERYVRVIVRYLNGEGFVITAYLVRRLER